MLRSSLFIDVLSASSLQEIVLCLGSHKYRKIIISPYLVPLQPPMFFSNRAKLLLNFR